MKQDKHQLIREIHYQSEIIQKNEVIKTLMRDKEMLDWIQEVMTNDDDYCEVFFAGLRNWTGKATAFQIESNPEKFPTINAPTLRDVIRKAMAVKPTITLDKI